MERGISSICVKTVEPVVVNPETDSKMASIYGRWESRIKGNAPNTPKTTQNIATIIKPSRNLSSLMKARAGSHSITPENSVIMNAAKNIRTVCSPVIHATTIGGSLVTLKSTSKIPPIRCMARSCMAAIYIVIDIKRGMNNSYAEFFTRIFLRHQESEKCHTHLKETLDLRHLFLVDQKQNDMILGLDNGIVVPHKDFLAAHDSANGRTGRQLD